MLGDFGLPVSMPFDRFDDLLVPFSCVVQNTLRKYRIKYRSVGESLAFGDLGNMVTFVEMVRMAINEFVIPQENQGNNGVTSLSLLSLSRSKGLLPKSILCFDGLSTNRKSTQYQRPYRSPSACRRENGVWATARKEVTPMPLLNVTKSQTFLRNPVTVHSDNGAALVPASRNLSEGGKGL